MNPHSTDSAEVRVERLSSTVRIVWTTRLLSLAAILFVGWHLASFVSLLREIRDSIQDHNVIIELDITEKRIEDATPQARPTAKPTESKPQFWRGT